MTTQNSVVVPARAVSCTRKVCAAAAHVTAWPCSRPPLHDATDSGGAGGGCGGHLGQRRLLESDDLCRDHRLLLLLFCLAQPHPEKFRRNLRSERKLYKERVKCVVCMWREAWRGVCAGKETVERLLGILESRMKRLYITFYCLVLVCSHLLECERHTFAGFCRHHVGSHAVLRGEPVVAVTLHLPEKGGRDSGLRGAGRRQQAARSGTQY